MLYEIVAVLLGLVLVVKGGDLFVGASLAIAKLLRIPPMVIGATLVSLATTTPELVVSVTASVRGDSGIAVGNAIGSCIANIGLVIGTVALITPVAVNLSDFRRRTRWMVIAGVLVMLFSWNHTIDRLSGIMLLMFAAAYLYGDYRHIRARRTVATAEDGATIESAGLTIGWFLIGVLLILAGSHLLVTSGIKLAEALGVSSAVIGLSVIAIGTSLPELTTGIAAAQKGQPELSIGNIIGANILNLGLIIGMSGAIRPLTLASVTQSYSYPWLAVFFAASILLMGRRGIMTRPCGFLLLGLYVVYLAGLVVAPAYLGN